MDDPTLPPPLSPRSASPTPAIEQLQVPSSDSVIEEVELPKHLDNSTGASPKEENAGDSEGRSDGGKQKRKRTRYVGPSYWFNYLP